MLPTLQAGLPGPDIGDLTAAFHTLSRSSQRLEQAYGSLVARVQQVDRELVESNQRLKGKVAELDSLTRYLNDILAGMDSGVVAIDGEGRITSFNRAAERALGLSADEALGQPHATVFRNADGSPPPLGHTLAHGVPAEAAEREVVAGSGERRRLSSSVAPIRNARGDLVGAVEIFSDLTEFRELQERLDQADKLAALGHMAAQVAHEIRNPLNSIEGFASLLVRDLDSEDTRRQFAQHIVTGSRSLNKIVTNLLVFSQPFVLQPRATSVHEVLEEALSFVEAEARQQGRGQIEVQRDYAQDADTIEADPDLLRQALMNLMFNASQAMAEGGTLRLAVAVAPERPECVEIRIEDSGRGIPQEIRDQVLDPFFTTRSKGVGLGLAIVQKIARRHGGRLELHSGGTAAPAVGAGAPQDTAEGGCATGTTATLVLPRGTPAAAQPPRKSQAPNDK